MRQSQTKTNRTILLLQNGVLLLILENVVFNFQNYILQ